MENLPQALYEHDGVADDGSEHFLSSELTRGPWDPQAQHGGPPSALLARSLERFGKAEQMVVTRISVELLRPVPLARLTVRTHQERPGRRVERVTASLFAAETEVARATALRMLRRQVALPDLPADGLTAPAPPTAGQSRNQNGGPLAFGKDGVEHCFVQGSFEQLGRAVDWIRLTRPLLADEPTSGLCRLVAAADFGNGVSAPVPFDGTYLFINADLSVYLHREPSGEWFCLDSRSHLSPLGVGLAESRLWDEQGPLGRSLQSLLVDRNG